MYLLRHQLAKPKAITYMIKLRNNRGASVVVLVDYFVIFRLACKQINLGGYRGWRLKVVEAFIIILTFTQLLYLLLLHAGMFSSRYGPGYRDTEYGVATGGEPMHKGGVTVAGTRV